MEMRDELKKGEKYMVKFDFNGYLLNIMVGFYKSLYKIKNGKMK